MRKRMVIAVGCLLLLTACYDMEFGIRLEQDLSGTVTMNVGIDMGGMAYFMAAMENMMSEEPPTQEQIEAARQEMIAQLDQEEQIDLEGEREGIEGDLPEGVELLEVSQSRDELKYTVRMAFGFRNVDLLDSLAIDEQDPEAEEAGNPLSRPFEGLRFVDEGSTYLLTTPALNPYADQAESGQIPPGQEDMLLKMFSGLRFALTFDCPFEVVEHNATRVEGSKLIWEYDLTRLQEMGAGGEGATIMARFKK